MTLLCLLKDWRGVEARGRGEGEGGVHAAFLSVLYISFILVVKQLSIARL